MLMNDKNLQGRTTAGVLDKLLNWIVTFSFPFFFIIEFILVNVAFFYVILTLLVDIYFYHDSFE